MVKTIPAEVEDRPLDELAELASCCRACPLWENATQTVFGEGDPHADIMLVGEQPGDREDVEGRPFVGPAGRLLDDALREAGLKREELYVTNAVKHFKWKPASGGSTRGGPRRLHDKANRSEMKACRPWLLGQIANVKPKTLLLLGNTAAQAVVGPKFRILSDRGKVTGANEIGFEGHIVATVHPSYLLRLRDRESRETEMANFVSELALAAELA